MNEDMFPGYPRGWFVVGLSKELAVGEVKPIKYFGRDLVMYRGESGEAIVQSAFCPHLGAHLGYGGKVEGDCIRCPFHAWRFDKTGKCDEVPYAKKIPPKAKIQSNPVQEKNGLIFMWNAHDEGEEPTWEIPVIPEYGTEGWTDWDSSLLEIKTHPKEVVENLADKGHFGPIHGTWVTEFGNEYEGHIGKQFAKGTAYPRGGGEDPFELQSTYYGPGYMITEMQSYLPNIMLLCHTPVTKDLLHVRIGAIIDVSNVKNNKQAFIDGYKNNILIGFREDIQIWENKQYRDRPVLCDGDGDLGALRRWYQQFYQPAANAAVPA
ncbi:MAG: Rieske 2Fe-2S domain-containing protein [Polyangiales bacterium]